MENKNFEGFKPLSEEDEKNVSGGQGMPDPCAPLAATIASLQGQIQMMERMRQLIPPQMQLQLQQFEAEYRICEIQNPRH